MDAEAYLKAFAAVASATFALILLIGAPRPPARWLLAFFLLLIAGNQATETLRSVSSDADARVLWLRAGAVFAALDPAILLYLVAVLAGHPRLRSTGCVIASFSTAGLLAFAFALAPATGEDAASFRVLTGALTTFTAVAYTIGTLALLRTLGLRHEKQWGALALAMSVATVPVWTRVPTDIQLALQAAGAGLLLVTPWLDLAREISGVTAVVVIFLAARPVDLRARRRLMSVLLSALALSLIIDAHSIYRAATGIDAPSSGMFLLGRLGAALRWLMFATLVSIVVLREGELDVPAGARRAGARVFLAVMAVGAGGAIAFVLPSLFGAAPLRLDPQVLLVLAAILLLSQGFRDLIDKAASLLYGTPRRGTPEERHAAYRAAVVAALENGRSLEHDVALRRLRDDLSMDERLAQVIHEAAVSSAPISLREGAFLMGRYRTGRQIGRGGHGRVFLAHDERLGRDVVVKEVAMGSDTHGDLVAEARAAAAVQHPNVISIYDAIHRPGFVLLIQEYAPGGSLESNVRFDGPLDLDAGNRMISEVLTGLKALHAAGVVHGDIKPSNVLVGSDGAYKVADFGISVRPAGATLRGEALPLPSGTPGSMAPEQLEGAIASTRSDVYAVGLLARRTIRGLPPSLARIVDRATRREPSERFADAGEMLAAWRNAIATSIP